MIRMKRAFTLIEVLVVIAIIAILAAILFPVFNSARQSAKQTACISNMNQVGLALHAYRMEYDDNWVCGAIPSNIGPDFAPQQMWVGYDNNNDVLLNGFFGDATKPATHPPRKGAIDIYLKDMNLIKCPSMLSNWQTSITFNDWSPVDNSPYYITNPQAKLQEYGPASKEVSMTPDGIYSHVGAPNSDIDIPAETLVVWEHGARIPLCDFLESKDWFSSPPQDQAIKDHFQSLHRNGIVGLWADGHAKRMEFSQLKRPWFSCRKDIYPK